MDYRPTYAVIGLGPVGMRLGRAALELGYAVVGYDVAPDAGDGFARAENLARAVEHADRIIAAVPANAAPEVAERSAAAMKPGALYEDWASSPAAVKAALAPLFPGGGYADVTLLDSITAFKPLACVAGRKRKILAPELRRLGLEVVDAGDQPGDAATVKMVRSLFMKPFEVMAIELLRVSQEQDMSAAALFSIERTLRMPFRELARMLLETNRRHADRRADEVTEVLNSVALPSSRELLEASRASLVALGEIWAAEGAPPPDADAAALLAYLALGSSKLE